MTAADLKLAQYPDDLPRLASDWRVTVTFDLNVDHVDVCEVCTLQDYDRDPERATMRLLYSQWDDVVSTTDVCDQAHADVELEWLLKCSPVDGYPRNIRLSVPPSWAAPQRLPSDLARTPPASADQAFADIEALVRHLHDLRNPCRTGEGSDGFELCRKDALAAVSQIGLKRVGDLEWRSAA